MLDRSYRVTDKTGRCWGLVILKWEDESCLHGYLQPGSDFEDVRTLFLRMDTAMSSEGSENQRDEISHTIANLGVVLEDQLDGSAHHVDPVVVSIDKLLFSCEKNRGDT